MATRAGKPSERTEIQARLRIGARSGPLRLPRRQRRRAVDPRLPGRGHNYVNGGGDMADTDPVAAGKIDLHANNECRTSRRAARAAS